MPSAVVVEVGGGYLRVIEVDTMPSAVVVEVGGGWVGLGGGVGCREKSQCVLHREVLQHV